MKALVYTAPGALEMREVPEPAPAADEALVRVERVGICGSDMHAFLGHDARRPPPLVLGHEAAGTVVGGPDDGLRVTVNPLVSCGRCARCAEGRANLCPSREILSMMPRPGAFAELVAVPRGNLVTVPDAVPLAKAALAEPIACGWHAVRLARAALHGALEDTDALVIGGGAIGVGAALSLVAAGARSVVLTEPSAARRAHLAGLGELDARGPDALDADARFALVIDGVGHAATRAEATARVEPGGVVMHIGLGEAEGGLDVRRMTLQEITVIGTYTYTPEDFRATARAIFDGSLGALGWTEDRPLADGAAAFADIRSGVAPAPKILLVPDRGDR